MHEILDKLIDISKKLRRAIVKGNTSEIHYLLHIEKNLAEKLVGLDTGMTPEPAVVEKIQYFRVMNKGNGILAKSFFDHLPAESFGEYDSSGRPAA